MKFSRSRVSAVLAAALLLALVLGCDPKGDSSTGEATIVVYTYDSFPQEVVELMTSKFKELHGATLSFEMPGDSGAIFTRLSLERAAPRADVFIGLDQTYLNKLFQKNLALPYSGAKSVVDQKLWVDAADRVTPFDYGYITLNVNTKSAPGIPTTWQELLDPKYAKSIIMLNPASSSPGRNFLLFSIQALGADGFVDFWRQLKSNVLTVAPGWSEGYGLYSQGEAPFVVSYDTSPAAHRIYDGSFDYDSLRFDGKAYLQVEVAGIVAGTRNPKLAGGVIDLLLSPEVQELLPLGQFMYPARTGVALPEGFESPNGLPDGVMMDPALVDANFDSWLAAWEGVMR